VVRSRRPQPAPQLVSPSFNHFPGLVQSNCPAGDFSPLAELKSNCSGVHPQWADSCNLLETAEEVSSS